MLRDDSVLAFERKRVPPVEKLSFDRPMTTSQEFPRDISRSLDESGVPHSQSAGPDRLYPSLQDTAEARKGESAGMMREVEVCTI